MKKIQEMISEAWTLFDDKKYDEARDLYRKCYEEMTVDDGTTESSILIGLIYVESFSENYDLARDYANKLLDSASNDDDKHICLHQLGMVERMAENYETALSVFVDEENIIKAAFSDGYDRLSANMYEQGYVNYKMGNLSNATKLIKTGPVSTDVCIRQFYGATYLLGQISSVTGIAVDLERCFGSLSKQILSIAYYLIIEEGQAMYRFHKWGTTHKHPYGKDLPSQRSSELFGLITEEAKMDYFKRQAKRHSLDEYLAFDTTSITSYSRLIKQAKYGKNKEGDSLPQINLALLYGEESMLPVYYRKLAGNITDVKTIENLLKDIDFLDLQKLKLVMDRGFYSEKNINDLMKHHHKFLIGAKMSLKLVSKRLDDNRADFISRFNYNSELKLYVMSFTEKWEYTEEHPRIGSADTDTRRIYLHLYYNDQKATDDKSRFNEMLDRLENNLVNGTQDPADEKLYQKYFDISETPVRGKTYRFKEDAIRKVEKNYGYFALMSNGIKDPVEALKIYRLKDLIEKSFGNLKERLSMRRMSVASEENFEGKLFVQFVALQLSSYIKKRMDDHGLFTDYTIQSLLDELDVIEYYQQPGRTHHLSEMTEKQRKLYEVMNVRVPT